MPFDYQSIDTSQVKDISDEMLLQTISGLHINCTGYGLIAEMCKRFEKLTGDE